MFDVAGAALANLSIGSTGTFTAHQVGNTCSSVFLMSVTGPELSHQWSGLYWFTIGLGRMTNAKADFLFVERALTVWTCLHS